MPSRERTAAPRPNVYEVWACPDCGMVLNGCNYNLDERRKKCSKTWHKTTARKREFVAARAVISSEAIDAAVAVLGDGHARSAVRAALLDAMRAAAVRPVPDDKVADDA